MSKIQKLFKAISLIARQPSLLNKVLDDESVNRNEVIKKYNLPQGLKTVDITDLVPNLNETIEPFCAIEGGSTPLDLALLKGLAKSKTECKYFEIGTWRGESVANVAKYASECVTLDLSADELIAMGLDKNYADILGSLSKDLKNVTHLHGNSRTFDYNTLNKKFDLIFIDGDHHYESVKHDTEQAFKLLKDGTSIVVWHDYGHSPHDIRWDVLKGILDGTPADKRKYLYRVSNSLCAIYTTKPFEAKHLKPFSIPDKMFSVTVTAKTR